MLIDKPSRHAMPGGFCVFRACAGALLTPLRGTQEARMRRVVYSIGEETATVHQSESYRVSGADPLTMDLYYPASRPRGVRLPAVIFVTGFPDLNADRMVVSRFKDMASFVSWAQLVAASGLVGVTYTNREPQDVGAVLDHLRAESESLGIDPEWFGLWACS